MAITKVGQPESSFMPVYNPIVYYFDSTNKSLAGFRYIVTIKDKNNVDLFKLRIMPQFGDNLAEVRIDELLCNLLTYDFNLTDYNAVNARNSYIDYKIIVGEEFIGEWDNLGFTYVDATTNGGLPFNPQRQNYTALSRVTQPPFLANDIINVTTNVQNPSEPSLLGVQKVVDVRFINSAWLIVLDLPASTGASFSTKARFADNRKVVYDDLYYEDNLIAFNAVFKTEKWLSYNANNYLMNNQNSKLLSIIDDQQFTVRKGQPLLVNYYKSNLTGNSPFSVEYIGDNGSSGYRLLTVNANQKLMQINIGTNALDGILNTTNLNNYVIRFLDQFGQQCGLDYKIVIDNSCLKEEVYAVFLDRLGSFIPFTFYGLNSKSISIDKEGYDKVLGNKGSGGYTYSTMDAGRDVYAGVVENKITLRTGYLNKERSFYLENLLTSPVVFLNVDGVFRRVVVETKNYTFVNNKNLMNIDITATFSNRDKINI